MKLKDLLAIMRSVKEENTTFTLVGYDIYDYLEGDATETIVSFSSDFKPKCFLKDSILEAEVIAMGMKSETEMASEYGESCKSPYQQFIDSIDEEPFAPMRKIEEGLFKKDLK